MKNKPVKKPKPKEVEKKAENYQFKPKKETR
jgi:hypothetical protein